MITHADYLGRRRITALDGIRAVSILLVFTAHPGYQHFWPAFHGAAGVTVFFVLSGYLISTLALREETADGRLDLGSFYLRRVFRIYPLYLAVLAFYVVLIVVLGFQPDRRSVFVEHIPYYLFGFPEHSTFFASGVPFDGAWSLGIEEKFYLVWPLLGFVLLASRTRARVGVLLALTACSAGAQAAWGQVGDALAPYALICIGCLVAVLLHAPRSYPVLSTLGRPRVLAVTTALLVVAHVSTDQLLPHHWAYVPGGVLVAAVLAGVVTTRSRGTGWLSSRPMVFLGTISYAFYLTHNFCLNLVEQALPLDGLAGSLVTTAIALVLSVLVAWVAHLVVEKPLLKVGHRLAGRRKRLRSLPAVTPPAVV